MNKRTMSGRLATICVLILLAWAGWNQWQHRARENEASSPGNASLQSSGTKAPDATVAASTPPSMPPSRPGAGLARLRRTFVSEPRITGTPGSPDQVIELESVKIHTGESRRLAIDTRRDSSSPYLVQFTGAIQPEWRSKLESLGGVIHGYLPRNTLVVDLTPSQAKRLFLESHVHWLQPYEAGFKVQPFLSSLSGNPDVAIVPVMISTFSASDMHAVTAELAAKGYPVIEEVSGRRWGWVRTEIAPDRIPEIAALDRVQWIEEYVEPRLLNDIAVNGSMMRVTNVWARGLTGEGQIIGHADTGIDRGTMTNLHQDLAGRVLLAFARGRSTWNDPIGHGTHTAGSIVGNGAMSTGVIRGVAWQAGLVHQSLLDNGGGLGGLPADLNDLFRQAYTNGARVHSDSWGSDVYGYYTTSSRQSDEFMWDNPDMLLVFSAGNSGIDSDNGVVDADSIGAPATAKNVLTVGAAESDRPPGGDGYSSFTYGMLWPFDYPYEPIRGDYVSSPAVGTNQGISAFSSRGPTDDGRVKPDVVAPGNNIVSTRSRASSSTGWGAYANTNYNFNGGTSMSTPLVAGSAALVRQYFQNYRGVPSPSAALVKAVLQHGARTMSPGQYGTGAAREVPQTVPNNAEGWGHIDLETSLFPDHAIWIHRDERTGLSAPGESREVVFFAATGMVKATMNYTDFPALAGSGTKLVNDLDISLHGPGNSHLSEADRLNPTEQVRKEIPVPGIYTARVEAVNIPNGPQPFALVISGPVVDQPEIRHVPRQNSSDTQQPYRVEAEIISTAPIATNAVTLFWKRAEYTGDFSAVTMTTTTGRWFMAEIPAQPDPSEILYFLSVSSSVFTVVDPVSAPTEPHRFLITSPLTLVVDGSPAPVFSVSPAYGEHLIPSGNVVRLSAPAATNLAPGMRVAVIGWNGSGSVPATGGSFEVTITLREPSAITWIWETQYALTQTSTVPGIVSTTTWWGVWAMASSTEAPLEATRQGTNYGFTAWTLDGARLPDGSSIAANPATGIAMFGPRSVSAAYQPAAIDANADGIADWWASFYFGTNAPVAGDDPDADGYATLIEYLDRTNPRDVSSVPEPPDIAHVPLTDPQPFPSPWKITAAITDNFVVQDAQVTGRNGDGPWQTYPLVASGSNQFEANLLVPGTNGEEVTYFIEAFDAAGLSSTNGPHAFTIQHPVLNATPEHFDEINVSDNSTTQVFLLVSNAGLAALEWTLDRATFYDNVNLGTGAWIHVGSHDVWHIRDDRHASAPSAWHFGNGPSGLYPDNAHAWLVSGPVRLHAAAQLSFDHWASMEYDSDQADNHYWDGGVVEVSIDGGTNWIMIEPDGGYPHRITDNPASPFPPETPCYGATDGWQPASFDLSAFANETVRIRFRFGSDGYVQDEGWYIDNVNIRFLDDMYWSWLGIVTNGSTAVGESTSIPLTLDTATVPMGEHREAILLLSGNDPTRDAPVRIPIALHNQSRAFTVTSGENGSVDPEGVVLVDVGNDLVLNITADLFFEAVAVYTNGDAFAGFTPAEVTNFTWANIQDGGSVHVAFAEKLAAGRVPEWWLNENGFTNFPPETEAVTDHDGDGMIAWQEYMAGTDPLDAESVALILTGVRQHAGEDSIEWISFTNTAYTYGLYSSTNPPAGFIAIATNLAAHPPVNVFTNAPADGSFNVYRVIGIKPDDPP